MTKPKHNYIPGKAYKMRNGEKAVFVGENPLNTKYALIFASETEGISSHCYNGNYTFDPMAHHLDIIGEWPPEPKKWRCWVNVHRTYDSANPIKLVSCLSKEIADNQADVKNRIACIPIEFTEGEGL